MLLGHSMGGKTAMLFAALYPEIVSKLIVADISPRFYPVHHDAILEGLSSLNFEEILQEKKRKPNCLNMFKMLEHANFY